MNIFGIKILPIVPVIIAVITALLVVFQTWTTIAPGYIGIIFDKAAHQVKTGNLEPGWAFINPVTENIQQYPVTIQTYAMVRAAGEGSQAGDDSIKVQSSEGQQLNVDLTIQYQVIKAEANALFTDWAGAGIDVVQDRVVRQYSRTEVPKIASQYGWEAINGSGRTEVTNLIAADLSKEFAKRHLLLVSVGIREVHLPDALNAALDQKIAAQQSAERQKYVLKQAETEAQQALVKAQGEANAILATATAQAKANKLLSQSLTGPVIEAQKIAKWNGELPQVSGGATPFIDLRTKSP
ncbi:MAG: prohibitin family protein [Anaerolineae bacterium]|nr:prohibitin family protein [Gloeobacterales cyanobacterium ES-bin-313]